MRNGKAPKPDATTQFSSLLSGLKANQESAPPAQQQPQQSAQIEQEGSFTPSEGPFAGKVLDKITGAVLSQPSSGDLVEGVDFKKGSKVTEHFDKLKADANAARQEALAAKQELEELRKTGTPQEQAVAKEEYERLKSEHQSLSDQRKQYEEELQKVKDQNKDLSGKLAQLNLDFDPDFQETYVKPFETIQTRLLKKINGLSENRQQADRIASIINNAVSAGDDEGFYATLRQLKDEDPDNYGGYVSDSQAIRDLLIGRIEAMRNHEKTIQGLKQQSYSTRERTVPEAFRAFEEVRQDIATQEADLEARLATSEFKNFLKSQQIDPDQIERQLRDAIRASHTSGTITKELLQYAAQGARKLQVQPLVSYSTQRAAQLEKENQELREQLNSLRGSSTAGTRAGFSQGNQQEILTPPTPAQVRRMSAADRQNAMRQGMPSLSV